MRKRIYEIIEISADGDLVSKAYDLFMMFFIVVSMIPIAMKNNEGIFKIIDVSTAVIFSVDYLLRLITADYKLKGDKKSFILYPFTFMAIIDFVSILPSISVLSNSFRILKVFRLFRTLRVFRVFKVIRYSKSISIIINVFKEQKESLMVVGGLAVGYVLVSALVIISVEPETFQTFFDAVYWATISLTTVGYGDIFAVSTVGKFITMLSSIFGIAIVALPAGIITAGYLDELSRLRNAKENDKADRS